MQLRLAADLQLPENIAGQTVALVGIRGSGKTNTAGVIAEELLARHQPIVVLDPTDAWWGLRSGYPVFIFGGPHGDMPLAETDGKVLAEFIVTEQVPLILSLRHLRKNAQRRFVTEFCEELYHLKGRDEYRSPLTVFIDESPLFIPQRVIGEVARTVGAVEDLIARGRNSGFGVVLISQRPATVNKDVLSQADTIISHRLTSPHDRKALAEWIEENATIDEYKNVLASLATQKTGQAWVWAPSLSIIRQVQIRTRETFDSSAAPKVGDKVKPPKRLAEIDLDKLKGKLAASIEKAKADDPKQLRLTIQRLEGELQTLKAAPAPKAEPTIKEVPLLPDHTMSQIQSIVAHAAEKIAPLIATLQQIHEEVSKTCTNFKVMRRHDVPRREPTPLKLAAEWGKSFEKGGHVQADQTSNVRVKSRGESNAIVPAERKILTVLAQHPVGKDVTPLAHLAGYTVNGHFKNMLGSLRSKGYATSGQPVRITAEGLTALGPFEPLPIGEELRAYWLRKVSTSEAKILQTLIHCYPESIHTADLAHESGYTVNGHFKNMLGHLRTIQLAEGRGEVRASSTLFE